MLWKIVTEILNHHLTAVIQFHDALHDLCTGRGARTSSLKFNLIQKLMAMRDYVLYEIFLYFHKVYYTMDRGHCLNVLTLYVIDSQDLRLLQSYWDYLSMVACYGGLFRGPFKLQSGMTQEDPLSPTIVNVVLDVVIRHLVSLLLEEDGLVGPESF